MILAMALADTTCPTFHIGSPAEVTMISLAHMLFDICKWTPEQVERTDAPAGSVNRRCPDVRKLYVATGWQAKMPLPEGLRKTVQWYNEAAIKTP